jgi:hypothetical protein
LGKEQFWRKALARFSDSGKSRAQFCADEGLKADVFVYWSKAILQRDAEVKQRNTPAAQNAQQVFVPVNMTAGTNQQLARPQKVVAQIAFSNGSVFLFDNIDLTILKHLFQALKETAH